jgi:uncharacterized protein involved in exopolysaccharide biosynthesis
VFGAIIAYTLMAVPSYNAKSLVAITNQDQATFLLGTSTSPKITDLEGQKVIIQSSSVMLPIYAAYGENAFILTVSNIKNSNIIEIGVKSTSPENAAMIANDIANNYLNYTAQGRVQDAQRSIDFINQKLETYDKEIYLLDKNILFYKNREKNLSREEQLAYNSLQMELTAKNKIYADLLTKREQAEIASSLSNGNVQIISYADVPFAPVKPNLMLNLALGFILAIGAAIGCAILANTIFPADDSKDDKKDSKESQKDGKESQKERKEHQKANGKEK